MSFNGPFLHSEVTIETPEFSKRPPSLLLSCQSSNSSLKSVCSTNDLESMSSYSEEDGSCRHDSDSGTVMGKGVLGGKGASSASLITTEEEFSSLQATSADASLDTTLNLEMAAIPKGSRLDQVHDRIFVQVSPEGDIKINHLACLAHVQRVILGANKNTSILMFNCQDRDLNVTDMFGQVIDCSFDLNSTPDLESFIRFCETCYDWLAGDRSNVVLFHAEGPTPTKRLLLLLFAYAQFCDSIERPNISTNRRLKAYLSAYPNGNTRVPVAYLRYAAYMNIFTPFRRQSISRASMSVHSVAVYNFPPFTDHSVPIFFKFYSDSPMRHVYTTNVHNISGRLSEGSVLLFIEEPISLRDNVILLCYRILPEQLERRRVFKLTFHSCEGYKEVLTFNYDAFDDISEAVPATFKVDLYLTPMDDAKLENIKRGNVFIENPKEIRKQNTRHISLANGIGMLNVIQSRDVPLEAVRLSDSLENIDHVPCRSILLRGSQEFEEMDQGLLRNRDQTFNDYFINTHGRQGDRQWSLPMKAKRSASKLPLVSYMRGSKFPKTFEDNSMSSGKASDGSSVDSGTGLQSEYLEVSKKSFKNRTLAGLKKLKKKIEAGGKEPSRRKKHSESAHTMPPPMSTVVLRARINATTAKSVTFTTAKPPPPRPPPPRLPEKRRPDNDALGEEEGQRKTPAGVRSIPTRYFGPPEKYKRVSGKDFAGVRSYRLQITQPGSERSTPTIIEEEEDFEEAEYRQLRQEGFKFHRDSMSTTATTKDLDQLLEELRRTSLDYSANTSRPIASHFNSTHSSHVQSSNQRSAFVEPTGGSNVGMHSSRSYTFTKSGANIPTNTFSSNSTSYQRSQTSSKECGSNGLREKTTWEDAGLDRYATPTTQIPSSQQQRYQTTFKAIIQHRPPILPKKFNQINVTIDPELGTTSSSMASDDRNYLAPSLSHIEQTISATPMDRGTEAMNYRELQLLEELSSARSELAKLKRASSVIGEPLHKFQPPSTMPTQRRAFQHHQENTASFSNRHQTQYRSHHDIHQGSSFRQSHGRCDISNSGFAYVMPQRAMSSANVTAGQSWNNRNGMMSGPQSPALGYSSIRSISGSLRSGGVLSNSQGYSARRERLRQEAEMAEARRMSSQHINHLQTAFPNDPRSTSLHQQRRQHYHSMSTIQPERREFEEIETVTLQPIGRGIQDLGSNMGSNATLNRTARRPVASSMLEGINRIDNSASTHQQRVNVPTFGRQVSAMDIPQTTSARPQHAASSSYLSSLRRQSTDVVSETSDFQRQMSSNKLIGSAGHLIRQPQQQQQSHHPQTQTSQPISTSKPMEQQLPQAYKHSVLFQCQQQQQHQDQQHRIRSDDVVDQSVMSTDRCHANQSLSCRPIAASKTGTNGPADLALVEATSPVWYRLKISRQEAISILKNQPPGSFLVRDSTTFKDAYGLAVKSTKALNKTGQKSGFAKFMKNILNDINSDLVRHYLIESVTVPTRGVRIKGFSAEQIFPNLLTLVQYHTQYPVALPCCLVLPPIPLGRTGSVITANNSTLLRNGEGSRNGDSDSMQHNNGMLSFNHTPGNFIENITAAEKLEAPPPARSITSPLSPTAGMFHSELTSPPPTISCRCLYIGTIETNLCQNQTSLMQAIDVLIAEPALRATTCDRMGMQSPVQYTECQLQVPHNESILLTDISRKMFFQRNFPISSLVYAGVDLRDKAFIHPNHSALGLDKPKLFGFITKKLSGEYMIHVFSEFDAICGAAVVTAQINSLLPNK